MSLTIFKRILAAAVLVVGSSALLAPSVKAQATDNGVVTGTVEAINTLTYTQPGAATVLPQAGITGMAFGSVDIQDNSNAGWTLTVASTNSGNLNNATFGDIAYTTINANRGAGVVAVDVSGGGAVNIEDVNALTCAVAPGCTYTLTADIPGTEVDGKAAGDYTDTLTFVLTAK